MAHLIATFSAAATLIAGAAHAQCPTAVTDAFVTSLGPVIATDGFDRAVRQPVRLSMLGRPVPHVMVERQYGAWKMLRFRLGQDVRESGQRVAADLEARFSAAYRGSTACGELSCEAYPDHGTEAGSLRFAELREADSTVNEDWTGPGVAALAVEDSGAVYLSCEYNGD